MEPCHRECPICGEKTAWPIAFQQGLIQGALRLSDANLSGYAWHLCQRCGNAYPAIEPDLEQLARAWHAVQPSGEADDSSATVAYQQRFSRVNAERAYRTFAPMVNNGQPGRMLDIACGVGETAHYFAECGWDVEATDADPATLRFHRERGIRSRIGQFETMQFDGQFDLVHIAHAIYFMRDPMVVLRRVAALLNPAGVPAVVLADFLASSDPGMPTYVHTFYPTAESMRYALALAGLETIGTRKISGSFYLAARPGKVAPPPVDTAAIHWRYRTKPWRYALFGRTYRMIRRVARAFRDGLLHRYRKIGLSRSRAKI